MASKTSVNKGNQTRKTTSLQTKYKFAKNKNGFNTSMVFNEDSSTEILNLR